ncbi:uncharacterized protein OCT59_021411 [Rhizophagus irregularis]|uniref:Uncharacterized protein n=2 Tax=Rhizophagus irregularis TaxID=588596 RepID=A0A015IK14_RHIIW|nr:hypothetical protein GLOIN_2v1816167 [Rhizophagus irregularis DAOM 181602=DAOM 197198]EXX54455.1 hypothetical protein RirG_234670 [Rhizophagus irregularis DAOM 197198w]POG60339.1 hypothetical protein GLOIN_2v1816167 [Rhizophagus irregularis DAOM 181602=DAOM 197198]UZO02935.1 hypothetical protein OCT59_021411 [Rhizophagus irregularis]GBC27442.2 hypothetical protein GLOIN_2v1816167 [Rhizophagus irregularis DAOM 181602=DAOM 197198]|eukprot:XP_025167205.1 hypothetical protein GLOIN_2v1816167 [Rhizophagus irregularis DAOM 181602=DAOM 197198]
MTSPYNTSANRQFIKEKRIYISSILIISAREKLLEYQKIHLEGEEEKEEEKEGYTGSREITLQENVSLDNYLRYIKNNKDKFNLVRIYLHDGSIKAYEVPLALHAYTSGNINVIMGAWNRQDFDYGNNQDLILGPASSRRPNCVIFPKHRSLPANPAQIADSIGGAYPTMVVEIGFSQSLSDLYQAVTQYFNQRTTIQIVLIIKIFGIYTHPNTNISTIALVAALFLRTNSNPLVPTSVVSFGTANLDSKIVNFIILDMKTPIANFIGFGLPDPNNNNIPFPSCNAAGIPTYIMNIPGTELFDRVPAIYLSPNFNLGCNIDLWELQTTIRRHLRI